MVRHDGLLFASGWHISADEYTKFVVDEGIARFHAEGLGATLEHCNRAESVYAQWYVYIATLEGEILGQYNALCTFKRCWTTGPSGPPRMVCG